MWLICEWNKVLFKREFLIFLYNAQLDFQSLHYPLCSQKSDLYSFAYTEPFFPKKMKLIIQFYWQWVLSLLFFFAVSSVLYFFFLSHFCAHFFYMVLVHVSILGFSTFEEFTSGISFEQYLRSYSSNIIIKFLFPEPRSRTFSFFFFSYQCSL